MEDTSATIENLKKLVQNFVSERDWWRFHTPRNLAASISIEAAELLEHFQWTLDDGSPLNDEKRLEVSEEMSDVLAYLLSLSTVLDIDLSAALAAKMSKNAKKYPSDKFQGNWSKVR
ncbi:MAG: nucleotide pyrophosphohydrolase [Candidatus Riflebacteria bacterium]|nr:nucleotide pyrophosphohydrolase [Candidatus Riflebacteria bacterium]